MNKKIVIIGEHQKGQVIPATYEMISFAKEIRKIKSYDINIIIIGKSIENTVKKIAENTGIHTVGICSEQSEFYNAELNISVLKEYLSEKNIKYILIPHTSIGIDYAPALAVKFSAVCLTGIEGFSYHNNEFRFTRSIFNNKIKTDVASLTETTILTVLPGSFTMPGSKNTAKPSHEIIKSGISLKQSKTLEIIKTADNDYPLSEADVIISAGRGIGDQENLDMINELADLFPKSAIGASRPLCDLGWLEYKHQIGTTGKTVTPKLYIACGISGTIQHISGMKGSNLIVAINKDPNAAIFNICDYYIIEDIATFIPILIKKLAD